ncbi:MAG: NTP transferase domain-containing protein [Actinomycetota bacterium]|nr:NTP transferase domain-containing protein [Actinomycetota bacterium]
MTTAVILAAGVGKRLATETLLPKWLAPVGDGTPCREQLDSLVLTGPDEVVAVVGVGDPAAAVERYVEPWRDRLSIRLLENPLHDVRNNWYSLLLALEDLDGGDDVLVFNSDLFAAAEWLAEAARRLVTCGEPAALGLDMERPLTDEAMKVSVEHDRCRRIGKVGVDQPKGEYVGISWWSADSAEELRKLLAAYLDQPDAVNNWYEHGIDDHLVAGASYAAVAMPSMDWVEIDDPSDLAAARSLATSTSPRR